MKLKIELLKVFHTGLAVRVLEQPEFPSPQTLYKNDTYIFGTYYHIHFHLHQLGESCLYISSELDGRAVYHNFDTTEKRDKMHDFILEAVEHINRPEILTFERIKKECVPMKHILVSSEGDERLYLGFNRSGYLVTDFSDRRGCASWAKEHITDWVIKEYKE